MYKNMENEDKKEIAKEFDVDYIYLESWIENLSYARNICANYGRLYGAKLTKTPKLYREYLNQIMLISMLTEDSHIPSAPCIFLVLKDG